MRTTTASALLTGISGVCAATTGVGDYVARGVSLSSSSFNASATEPVATALVTAANGVVVTATKLANGEIIAPGTTVYPDQLVQSNSSQTTSAAATITGGTGRNGSVDECWSSWDKYWSASGASLTVSASFIANGTTTDTETFTEQGQSQDSTYTQTVTSLWTSYEVDGGHTIATSIIDGTTTLTHTQTSSPDSTYVATFTSTLGTYLTPSVSIPPKPTCVLPSSVSQCQSQWEHFVSAQIAPSPTPPTNCNLNEPYYNKTTPKCLSSYAAAASSYYSLISATPSPACTQASIGGSICQAVRDDYVTNDNYHFLPDYPTSVGMPWFFDQGTIGLFNGLSTSWYWGTTETLGVPSCTLGCGQCAVTGGTVQLLYWPSTASATATNTALVTLETLGTTLTSPTLYISFTNVYAQNACSSVGTQITSTILPIPADKTLSSVWGYPYPCDAHLRPTNVNTFTASFNVTDLNSPVPSSIYTSMPVCATSMRCGGSCNVTDYKPIIVIPTEVLQEMEPAWAGCHGDLRGVYDPPIALQVATSAAGATLPGQASQTPDPPTPGSGVTSGPAPTAEPDQTSGGDGPTLPPAGNSPTAGNSAQPAQSQPAQSNPSPAGNSAAPAQSSANPAGIIASVLANSAPAQGSTAPQSGTPASPAPQHTVATIGSQEVTIAQPSAGNSGIVVVQGGSSATIAPGASPVSIGGQQVSVVSNGGIVVGTGSGASTLAAPVANSAAAQTIATVGSQAFTVVPVASASGSAAPSGIVVANGGSTATLAPGASATLGGQVISAPSSSGGVVIGSGSNAATVNPVQATAAAAPVITVAGSTITANSASAFVIGGSSTLAPGGSALTISGTTYSLPSSGSAIVVNGATQTLHAPASASGASAVQIGSQTFSVATQTNGEEVFGNGQTTFTLSAGGSATTVDDVKVSAASSGEVVAGSSTIRIGGGSSSSSSGSSSSASSSSSQGSSTGSAAPASSTVSRSGATAQTALSTMSLIIVFAFSVWIA